MCAYFLASLVKNDLGITDTSQDTNIANWGLKADDEVDNYLYDKASKSGLLTALPVLPLSSAPTSVKDASNDLVKEQYFVYIRDLDHAKYHRDAAVKALNQYIERLKVDAEIYGVVIGDRATSFGRSYLDSLP